MRIKSITDNKDNITLITDTISLKTNFVLKNIYKIDFTINNTFGELLGFDKILIENKRNRINLLNYL